MNRSRPATGITPPLNQKRTGNNSGKNECSKIPRAAFSNGTHTRPKTTATRNPENDSIRQHTKVIELTIDPFTTQPPSQTKVKPSNSQENTAPKSSLPQDNSSTYKKSSTKTKAKTTSTRPLTAPTHELRSNKTPRQFDSNLPVGSQSNIAESEINQKVSFALSTSNTSNTSNLNMNSGNNLSNTSNTNKKTINRTSSRQTNIFDNSQIEAKSKPSRPQTAVPKGSRKIIQETEVKKTEKHKEEEDENYGMTLDDVKLEWMDDLDKLQEELNDNVRKSSYIHPNLESSVIKAGLGAENKLTENSTEHDAIQEANRIIDDAFTEFQQQFDEEGDLIDRRIELLNQIQQTIMEHSAYDYTADQIVDDEDDFDEDLDFEKPKIEPRRAKTASTGSRRPKY